MIDVLAASVPEISTACDLALGSRAGTGLSRVVSEQDRAAARRRHHRADAQRVLAGRAGLRLLTARRLDLPATAAAGLPIERRCRHCDGPHGQPQLAGLSLSSATSDDQVLVAVGRERATDHTGPRGGVGVDVQYVPAQLFDGFDAFALHPAVRQELPAGRAGISARIASWVAAEAVLKTVGVGLDADPAALRIVGPVAERPWRRVAEADRPELVGVVVTALRDRAGYRGAVASTEPDAVNELTVDDLVGDLLANRARGLCA